MDIKDKTVVLTGALTGMTRKEATSRLEAIGANVLPSVTKATDILFYGDKPGSKLTKAENYGVVVYDEAALLQLLDTAPLVPLKARDDDEEVEVLQEIDDGEVIEVQGSAAKPYELKNVGGVYSCSCPAWRNQSLAIDIRTCKHLRAIRGEAAEAKRVGGSHSIRKTAKTESDKPQLLLAQKWENHIDPTGWWMSEKLDGVRAYWDGSTFWSRLGNEFLAPDWFTADLPKTPLDGELWMARGEFQKAVGIVKRQDRGSGWKDLTYVVFDAPKHSGLFEERQEFLQDQLEPDKHKYARVLEHVLCKSSDHMLQELKRIEALQGEGVMLRRQKSEYVGSRSSSLLKVKTFHDNEAKVIGYTDGAGRHRGRIGALILARPDGVTFHCGTGLSDHDREDPPKIGSVVTYRYQELTKAGVPRFPSYVGERADAEWPETAVEVKAQSAPWPAANSTAPEKSAPASSSTAKAAPKSRASARPAPVSTPTDVDDSTTLVKDNKVWQLARTGTTVTLTLDSEQAAIDAFERIIGQQVRQGFATQAGGSVAPAPVAPKADVTQEITRRCEYTGGSSNKFWEVTVAGATQTVCYGRIGTKGQSKQKEFPSADAADADAQKQFQKKLNKGYQEV